MAESLCGSPLNRLKKGILLVSLRDPLDLPGGNFSAFRRTRQPSPAEQMDRKNGTSQCGGKSGSPEGS
jgi:hypothetical protein